MKARAALLVLLALSSCVLQADPGKPGEQGPPGGEGPKGDPGDSVWTQGSEGISYSGGNVGVGTDAPSACIDVQGTLSQPLTGVVAVPAGSSMVIGGGTLFTQELRVGDAIRIGDEVFTVARIADDTQLTLSGAHVAGALNATAYADPPLVVVQNGAGQPVMVIDKSGTMKLGHEAPGAKLEVQGGIKTTSDFYARGYSITDSITVRTIVTKQSANAVCPIGKAIYTPWSYRGQTGAQICAADHQGLHACGAVVFVYVNTSNGFGTYPPNDIGCESPVPDPWPWGTDYNVPDTLDGEWSHGNTHVVCCY
jgi:hypothetical protein